MYSCRSRQIRAGWGGSPSHRGHAGRTTPGLAAWAAATPRQAQGPGVRGRPALICPMSSLATQKGLLSRTLGPGQKGGQVPSGLPWSLTSLPRCYGPAETGSEGAREELAGPEPGSRAHSPPGCSCTKVLISSGPRLGAEHALGICHEAAGTFATVSRGAEQEGGFPDDPIHCSSSMGQVGQAVKARDKMSGLSSSHGT